MHDLLFVQCPTQNGCPTEHVLGTLNIYILVIIPCSLAWVNM